MKEIDTSVEKQLEMIEMKKAKEKELQELTSEI